MENLEDEVKNELNSIGFNVIDIPRGNASSADFEVVIGDIKSVIEVKTMNDTPKDADNYFQKLMSGEPFEFVGSKDTRKNINKAFNQINTSYDSISANGFKCICVYSNVMNTFVDIRRRVYDFYGICDFFCFVGYRPIFVECYGFYKSVFDIYTDIDCVMLMSKDSKQLLINNRSIRSIELTESEFLKCFQSSDSWSIYDPQKMIKNRKIIYLDDRELAVDNPGNLDISQLLQHENSPSVVKAKIALCEKYGYSQMGMEQNRGRSFVIGH
ncbi:hypothetical protein [Vibrio harveyi]|uniref:hypothetical protein n=1 Tax=Vibrio harveyi TaxID=669 RepID=UPI003CFAA345